jgi:hypothetical protein
LLIKFLILLCTSNKISIVTKGICEYKLNSNNNNKQQFFVSQIALFGILFGIVLIISLLLPFPVSLVAILGVFVLRNMYKRRLMMKRMSNISEAGGMFGSMPWNFSSSSNSDDGSSLKYRCTNCEAEHKKVACPKCTSQIKKAIFDD